MKFLVINGHKYYPYAQGRLNKTLFDRIVAILSDGNEIQTTIVENGYDVDEEIKKYLWADTVIYQNPVNWFSAPWLLKKYYDEIFKHGVFYGPSTEYGRGGLLNGKKYMYSLTWNSPEEAFQDTKGFYDGRSVDDIIISLHKLHEFCGFDKIKTFSCHDVVKHPDISLYLERLNQHLYENVLTAN